MAEQRRPDVRVVDQELLGFAWQGRRLATLHPEVAIPGLRLAPATPGGFSVADLLDANSRAFPIVVCGGFKGGDAAAGPRYDLWPLGLCERVHLLADPVDIDTWLRDSEAALPRIEFAGPPRPPGSWEEIVEEDYWGARQRRAAQLINYAGPLAERRPFLRLAAGMLESIVESDPHPVPLVYKTLAIALGRAGLESPEDRRNAAEAWRKYLQVAPRSDPMLPAIGEELRRLEQ